MSTLKNYQLVKTRLQEQLDNGTTRCNLCLWRCKIGHGQRGFCQAHVNRHGTLYNLSYGILSSLTIDAIEEKPVRHFRPSTRVMSVGSYGCSFRCGGCHNLEISWGVSALDDLAKGQSKEVWVSPASLIESALKADVQGIAFTYSEPAVWLEYVLDVSQLAQQAGLYTVYVSNSFITDEALELVAPYIDVLCSDIKSMSNDFYRDICKTASVDQVLHSIKKAQDLGIHVETRTNIIPGKNDDPEELYAIVRWVYDNLGQDSPWHITRFFPAYQLSHIPATPEATMLMAEQQAIRAGLNNIYVHIDKGCDCAKENQPVNFYINSKDRQQVNQCAATCCGDKGILLKKYESENNSKNISKTGH